MRSTSICHNHPGRLRALGLMFVILVSRGEAQTDFYAAGNRHYQAGDYGSALENYLRIVEAGYDGGPLRYNIGNAYFKLGRLGQAILNYERALRLSPGDDDVRANLELARSLTVDEITPLPGFWPFRVVSWWVHLLPRPWLLMVVTTGYLTTAAGTALVVLWRGTSVAKWSTRIAVLAGMATLLFGTNLVVMELGIGEAAEAIILVDEVAVQSAPSEDSSLQLFSIHEGTKVRIDRRTDEWAEIVLEDGKVGWVPATVFEVI